MGKGLRLAGAIRGEHARVGLAAVMPLIHKFRHIFGMDNAPMPVVTIRDNVGSSWLGRHLHWPYRARRPNEIQIQRSVLQDARTLERVVAHEMAHNFVAVESQEAGLTPPDEPHGRAFLAAAAIINRAVGDDCFITVTSDQTYSIDNVCLKPYTLLIGKAAGGGLGYTYAVRPSAEQKAVIERALLLGARVAMTTDLYWAQGRALKIGSRRLTTIDADKEPKRAAELIALFNAAEDRTDLEYAALLAANTKERAQRSLDLRARNRAAFERDLAARRQPPAFGELPPAPPGGALHTRLPSFAAGTARAKNIYPVRARERAIAARIVNALDVSDLQPQYRRLHERPRGCDPMTGHCHTATNAFFHATGGFDGPYLPYFIEHEGASHWYLVNTDTGAIVDLTASQFKTQPPYERGRRGPAMRGSKPDTDPTHRAARLLARAGFIRT